ncbi:MAG TPA: glycosyltransferase [Verrucomicrobiae bacterium]|nr:glycosyltransferase [Verrucomicrobiae bacterium]
MIFCNTILAVLALLSLALLLWQWFAARRFPLHQRITDFSFSPAITLLKPLKGCDATTAESLRSWFRQNYTGRTQILFGVADATDPVCKIVRELIAENPEHNSSSVAALRRVDAQLIVCDRLTGANAKVAKLVQLEKLAKHDLILVSDADVRVPPDFLANVVAPLSPSDGERDGARGKVGLVSCFYRLANPTTTAMQWEAVAINADFWSQVLQAASLKPLDFALGAVMLTPRKLLAEIGGFDALADCLADDYQLGHWIAGKGHRIALCPAVVECWDAPMNWSEVWKHQLRWARTIRVCQPLPYFFSILSNATFWPLLWLATELPGLSMKTAQTTDYGYFQTSGFAIGLPCGIAIAVVILLMRIILAQNLQRRLTGFANANFFWMVPVKDLLQVAIWFGAFAGRTVEWRGRRMKLRRDGTLVEEK